MGCSRHIYNDGISWATETCSNMDYLKNIIVRERSQMHRWHTVWFHLHEIPRKGKTSNRKQTSRHLGLRVGIRIKNTFLWWWKCSQTWLWSCLHNCINLLKLICVLKNGWMLWYVNYTLRKLRESKQISNQCIKKEKAWE